MSLPFPDPYENMTPQHWLELSQRERYERDAARRRFLASLVFCIRAAMSVVGISGGVHFFKASEPDEQTSIGGRGPV